MTEKELGLLFDRVGAVYLSLTGWGKPSWSVKMFIGKMTGDEIEEVREAGKNFGVKLTEGGVLSGRLKREFCEVLALYTEHATASLRLFIDSEKYPAYTVEKIMARMAVSEKLKEERLKWYVATERRKEKIERNTTKEREQPAWDMARGRV